jgi:hypothetical protein
MLRMALVASVATLASALAAAAVTAPSPPLLAAQAAPDLRAQLRTAIQHAGFAADGDSLGYVRLHLGHALNCIEGPAGKAFDRTWGNVCQGQGTGIMPDLPAAPGGAAYRLVIEHADALAASGVRGRDLAESRAVARAVRALLTVIADGVK